ncbi:uncharacterized protein BO95DRAFT_79472 [Aspergillus brunneoviolaceus CBS 621.78]|uniref:Uncharacterized protein n=1 Tax=Aspergillus brunneoviolaceus CBS 621.78 TaxID=1450534 RepID=A0ACD1GEM9_9EURO|nr:hypothetical protein BO95DRAFT_79472 [Aspergillus brunneoviolaceus CBS 621.78]RAH47551.1 hypothetical protein BO95DRAFT_79472 [Aspergillus brunneoviolaceus CBS 621.78]
MGRSTCREFSSHLASRPRWLHRGIAWVICLDRPGVPRFQTARANMMVYKVESLVEFSDMGGDELTGVFAAISQRQRQGFTRSQGWPSQRFHCSLPPPTDKISMNVWSSTSVPTATPCEEPISQEPLIYRRAGSNLPSTRIRPFENRSLDPPITRREMIALRYPLHQHSPCNVRCICCGGTLAPAFQGHSRGGGGMGSGRKSNPLRRCGINLHLAELGCHLFTTETVASVAPWSRDFGNDRQKIALMQR